MKKNIVRQHSNKDSCSENFRIDTILAYQFRSILMLHLCVILALSSFNLNLKAMQEDTFWSIMSGNTDIFFRAVKNGYTRAVKLFIENGANIEAHDNYGCTALIMAAGSGHQDTVQLLLDQGANIEAQDNNGFTALTLTAFKGHTEIIELLIEKGARLETQNKARTALFCEAGPLYLGCWARTYSDSKTTY